jgi:hypothetical protein
MAQKWASPSKDSKTILISKCVNYRKK